MEVEFKKDIRNNYMVIALEEVSPVEAYCRKLFKHQILEGVLLMEQKRMDQKVLLYYDITAKQSMSNVLDKAVLSYDKLKLILKNILITIEKAYDYLLPEDDFILTPEFIYLDMTSYQPYLCYYFGYHKDTRTQMNSLMEYLMNKVDYNDKEAVLLIYHLYAVGREEGFTIQHLLECLQNNDSEITPILHNSERKVKSNDILGEERPHTLSRENEKKYEEEIKSVASTPIRMPIMKEKIEEEAEVSCYPFTTYLYTAGCVLGGFLLVSLAIISKILYNAYGDRIDYSKVFGLLVILLCFEGYLLKLIWDKKNKITKIIQKQEYIDPRSVSVEYRNLSTEHRDLIPPLEQKNRIAPSEYKNQNKTEDMPKLNSLLLREDTPNYGKGNELVKKKVVLEEDCEEDNPTCFLNQAITIKSVILKAVESDTYQDIKVSTFPFFIGKLKTNVDYCLKKDVVSRFHAKITMEGDGYFITDLNSTNGTYVNQKALNTYEKVKINPGDEIAFADIRYQFVEK